MFYVSGTSVKSALTMIAFLTLGPITLSACAQHKPSDQRGVELAVEIADQHPLVKAFQACVSATGLAQDLPLAAAAPKFDSTGHLYQLNDVGRIRDGYRHFLYVSADGKTLYIQQIGGIAGTNKMFGPLDPLTHCQQASTTSPAK